jgi:hypothetical protein
MTNQALQKQLRRLIADRWAWQGIRVLLRACWVGVSIWCIGLGGSLLWDWPLRTEWLGAASLACLGVALFLLLRPQMRVPEAARRLDRRFGLHESLATAVEVAADAPPGSVASHLVSRATRDLRQLRHDIRQRQPPPWGEFLTLLCLCLAAVGLLLLSGIGVPGITATAEALPPLAAPRDPNEAFPQEPPAGGVSEQVLVPGGDGAMQPQDGQQSGEGPGTASQGGDPRTMQAIADALRDQGATRSAADALDQGDAAGAAQELRELADRAGELSPSARGDMADGLRQAAREIDRTDPQMAEQLEESASGLEGSPQEASEALEDLAGALDDMAGGQDSQAGRGQGSEQGGQQGEVPGASSEQQSGQGQSGRGQNSGAGNTASGEQRPVQPERLGVDGRPVELTAEGGGQAGGENRPATTVPGSAGETGGGDPRAAGTTGPDPLRIPLDERDVVQGYFSPPGSSDVVQQPSNP